MLRVYYNCLDCETSAKIDDVSDENISVICPICDSHRVDLTTDMSKEEYLQEISRMTKSDLSKYSVAIRECANYLLYPESYGKKGN